LPVPDVQFILKTVSKFINLGFAEILVGPGKSGKSDSGIDGPSYGVICSQISSLADQYPHLAQSVYLGDTESGRETMGLLIRQKDVPTKKLMMNIIPLI